MTQAIHIGTPATIGGRKILPLVREEVACWPAGAVGGKEPVALLICDAGKWFFAPLEPGIAPDVVHDLIRCIRISS